jgi:hypothetical protein
MTKSWSSEFGWDTDVVLTVQKDETMNFDSDRMRYVTVDDLIEWFAAYGVDGSTRVFLNSNEVHGNDDYVVLDWILDEVGESE